MYQKIIHFIKYHNAFSIGVMVIFVGLSLTLAASPEARKFFLSSEEVVYSEDNSFLLATNLDNWDFDLRIISVEEDEEHYYITYTYKTIGLVDFVWQPQRQEKTLKVFKKVLEENRTDLGLYTAEELGEVIDYELGYLREVQKIQQRRGLNLKVVATEYSGLIGRYLDPEKKVFPGYVPVISPKLVAEEKIEKEPELVMEDIEREAKEGLSERPVVKKEGGSIIDKELIVEIVNQILEERGLLPVSTPTPSPTQKQSPESSLTEEVTPTPSPTPEPS